MGSQYSFGNSISIAGGTASLTSNVTQTQLGGLLGFGTEYMFAPHWTAKIEYNYADYGKHSGNFPVTAAATGILLVTTSAPIETNLQVHTMKSRINYIF